MLGFEYLWNVLTYLPRRLVLKKANLSGFVSGVGEFYESYNLSGGVPATDRFDNYVNSRIQNLDGFSDVKAPDGKSITEKLTAGDADADYVREQIQQTLALHADTTTAQDEFNQALAAVNDYVTDPTSSYNPGDFASYLMQVKGAAYAKISHQYDLDKENLTNKFQDAEFVTKLKNSLGLTTDAQVNKVKQDMLSTIDSSKTKALEEFEKPLNEHINKLHQSAQTERDRISFLANLYENNKAMRQKIDELAEQNRKAAGSGVSITIDNGRALFKGINVKDLVDMNGFLQTTTGRSIRLDAKTGEFSMKLPNRWLSSSYYMDGGGLNRRKADMLSLAQAVRASGYPKITMTVSHKNPEHAQELLREAYEACRAAGYEDKDITLQLGDKKMTPAELFADKQGTLQAIETASTSYQQYRAADSKQTSNDYTTAHFREAVFAHRAAVTPPPAAEPAPPATPTI